jgi:hypothetical protein
MVKTFRKDCFVIPALYSTSMVSFSLLTSPISFSFDVPLFVSLFALFSCGQSLCLLFLILHVIPALLVRRLAESPREPAFICRDLGLLKYMSMSPGGYAWWFDRWGNLSSLTCVYALRLIYLGERRVKSPWPLVFLSCKLSHTCSLTKSVHVYAFSCLVS